MIINPDEKLKDDILKIPVDDSNETNLNNYWEREGIKNRLYANIEKVLRSDSHDDLIRYVASKMLAQLDVGTLHKKEKNGNKNKDGLVDKDFDLEHFFRDGYLIYDYIAKAIHYYCFHEIEDHEEKSRHLMHRILTGSTISDDEVVSLVFDQSDKEALLLMNWFARSDNDAIDFINKLQWLNVKNSRDTKVQ